VIFSGQKVVYGGFPGHRVVRIPFSTQFQFLVLLPIFDGSCCRNSWVRVMLCDQIS